jgi:hypothetical protein
VQTPYFSLVTQLFDLIVWAAPKDVDDEQARDLVARWLDAGGDPQSSPFESTTDIGWFYRELKQEHPDLDAVTDAKPTTTNRPVWLSGSDEPPARVVGIRLADDSRGVIETVLGLAVKYDLIVLDPRSGRVTRPQQVMSDYASATFWPSGAIRSVVAAVIGVLLVVGGWVLGIPIVGWLLILVGAFLVVLSVVTLVAEGRKRIRAGSVE